MENRKVEPKIGKDVFIAPGAMVVGDVTLEDGVSVWYQSTIRGDDAPIYIRRNSNIQDNAVLHVDDGISLRIGEGTTVGHAAILHGCDIGDNTLIGMGAIVLNGARIGNNCMIAAGALVTQNKEIPDGSLVVGSPGKVVRKLTEEEIEAIHRNAEKYLLDSKAHKEGEFQYVTGKEV